MKIFITGGTSGIGLALAKKYLQDGHRVAVSGRNLAKLPDDFKDNANFKSYQVSVTDRTAMESAITKFAKDEFQEGLDLVVANAGIGLGRKVTKPNFERAREVLDTNIFGVMNTFEPAIKIFFRQGYGHLVGVSSVAAFLGTPGGGPYCASKAAVLRLCESYNIDLRNYNIDVTAIAPGFIDTPLTRKNNHKMPFLLSAEVAANRIAAAIARKEPLYVFPRRMAALIFILSNMPRALYRKIMAKAKYCEEE